LFGLHANELVIFFVNVHNALLLHALVIRAAQVCCSTARVPLSTLALTLAPRPPRQM